jgi:hypothetical protein
MFLLRPDLHNELKCLALDEEDKTPLPELILGTRVTAVVYYVKALDMS